MSVTIKTRVVDATPDAIGDAARVLSSGGLVAFPTETVYGLGADATNGKAVARIFAAKGRPEFNPLIAHVIDLAAARELATFDPQPKILAKRLWPGPLTLVLPKSPRCSVAQLATAGLDTIAVRVPGHPIARDILTAFGRPVAAPSANRSGHVSPTTAQHVIADLGGRIDLVVDGGATDVGVESTIIACLGARATILRSGGVTRESIEAILGKPLDDGLPEQQSAGPHAPGQLASHYAPNTPLRLEATSVEADEVLLAFGPAPPKGAEQARAVLNLSASGDLVEAAANLFAHLRALDEMAASTIAVMPVPRERLGEAINDRLSRAAAPRPQD